MKKISIIGFGGHVKKNILPALNRSNFVEIEGVYVRNLSSHKDAFNSSYIFFSKSSGELVWALPCAISGLPPPRPPINS